MAKRSGTRKLLLRPEPAPVYFPNKVRVIGDIAEPLRAKLRRLCAGDLPWPLVLLGPPGVGKTCAALCLLDYCSGFYWSVGNLCDTLIQAQKGDLHHPVSGRRIYPAQLWEEMATAKLVVLDELGARERVSDFMYDTIKRVIDDREGLPLVVLSNLTLEQLARVYDDRITSRLAGGTVVILKGRDRRLPERK